VLIAVVDDDDFAREAIAGLLRALGHEALEFRCAGDVIAVGDLTHIACLIADMRMPGLTGLDLHRHLVATGVRVPTVLVTAFPSDAVRTQALAAGVRAYLSKPLQADILLQLFAEIGLSQE